MVQTQQIGKNRHGKETMVLNKDMSTIAWVLLTEKLRTI